MRVLIIEDYSPAAFLLASLCESVGRIVEIAYTMRSAREKLSSRERYDLVFLDLTLTDSSPEDSLAEVTMVRHKTPVVIVTGNESTELKSLALANGAADYLEQRDPNFSDRVITILESFKGH